MTHICGQDGFEDGIRLDAAAAAAAKLLQSCLTLRDPMDCSPPGSSVHGIFQARVLEWVAIAFSKGWMRIVLMVIASKNL